MQSHVARSVVIVICFTVILFAVHTLQVSAVQVLYSDDFNDNLIGSSWEMVNGTWNETDGVMVQSSNYWVTDYPFIDAAFALAGNTTWTDYTLTADFKSSDNDRIGVVFRYRDSRNFCLFSWDRELSERIIICFVDGVENRLASDTTVYETDTWYHLKIRAEGTTVKCYLDDVLIFNVTDSIIHTQGKAGLYANGNQGSYWDNFQIEGISGGIGPGNRVLYSDDFNDNLIGTSWEMINGTWNETDGVMVQSSNYWVADYPFIDAAFALAGNTTWTDYTLTADFKSSDNDRIGVVFRYRDSRNFCLFSWDRELSERIIICFVDGVENRLAADTNVYETDTWYSLKITAEGTTVKCYLDDILIFNVTDSIIHTQGKAGLYSNGNQGSYWDNFKVYGTELNTTVLYSDDFDDNQIAVSWDMINGAWVETNGEMVQTSNYYDSTYDYSYIGAAYALVGGAAWSDYDLSVSMKSSDNDRIGVVFYYQDSSNFYLFLWESEYPKRVLVKYVDGTGTQLAADETPYAYDTWYSLKITADATAITVSINDIEVLSANDATFREGKAGLYANANSSSYWDNFTVYQTSFQPPTNLVVADVPNDNGHSMLLSWTLSEDDALLTHYAIFRSRNPELTNPETIESFSSLDALIEAEQTTTIKIATVPRGQNYYTDTSVPLNGVTYYYWVQAVSQDGASKKIQAGYMTAVDSSKPAEFGVDAPYPNPFNSSTTLGFTLVWPSRVTIVIYDILGREVAVITNDIFSPGTHRAVWDGKDKNGVTVGSGPYLYMVRAGSSTHKGKIMFLQ